MRGRNINEALMGRALLWLAWLCPAALTVTHATNLSDAMADTGRPGLMLSKLRRAPEITHVDVANLYLALAGARDGPVEPTANPTTWAKVAVGDDYRVVPCSALQP